MSEIDDLRAQIEALSASTAQAQSVMGAFANYTKSQGLDDIDIDANTNALDSKLQQSRRNVEDLGASFENTQRKAISFAQRAEVSMGGLVKQMGAFAGGLTTGQQVFGRSTGGILKALNYVDQQIRESTKSVMNMSYAWSETSESAISSVSKMDQKFRDISNKMMIDMTQVKMMAGDMAAAFEMTESLGLLDEEATSTASGLGVLEKTIAYARGSGLEYADVLKDMKTLHYDYGRSIEDTTAQIGRMIGTSEKAKMSTITFVPIVSNILQQFRMWGVNIDEVTSLTAGFAEKLGDSKGLVGELAVQFVTGMKNMSFSQKAFLSMITPGAAMGRASQRGGAIAGGLAFEETLAGGGLFRQEGEAMGEYEKRVQGNAGMGDLVQSVMNLMKRTTGGRGPMTREAALAGNAGDQQAYFMQRKLLQQFGLAGNTEQSERLLQVLSQLGEGSDIMSDLTDNLVKMEERGLEYGRLSTEILTKVHNTIQTQVAGTLIDLYAVGIKMMESMGILKVFGITGKIEGETGTDQVSSFIDLFSQNIEGILKKTTSTMVDAASFVADAFTGEDSDRPFETIFEKIFDLVAGGARKAAGGMRGLAAGTEYEDRLEKVAKGIEGFADALEKSDLPAKIQDFPAAIKTFLDGIGEFITKLTSGDLLTEAKEGMDGLIEDMVEMISKAFGGLFDKVLMNLASGDMFSMKRVMFRMLSPMKNDGEAYSAEEFKKYYGGKYDKPGTMMPFGTNIPIMPGGNVGPPNLGNMLFSGTGTDFSQAQQIMNQYQGKGPQYTLRPLTIETPITLNYPEVGLNQKISVVTKAVIREEVKNGNLDGSEMAIDTVETTMYMLPNGGG